MIEFEEKLEGVNIKVVDAIKTFWLNMNPYTIQILAGKCNEIQTKAIISLGGNLTEVNENLSNAKMPKVDLGTNNKVAKPKYADILKKGDGVLFVVRSSGFRHKTNTRIKDMANYVKEIIDGIEFEIVENSKHDCFFFYIKKKKEKDEIAEEPTQEQISNE